MAREPVKNCSCCKKVKPFSEFGNNKKAANGKQSWCKLCMIEKVKRWQKKNYEKYRADGKAWQEANAEKLKQYRRRYDLRKKYGLTEAQYEELFVRQGGRCAICNTKPKRIVVDHCHSTGIVRGLLCGNCNVGLGHFGHDLERLQKAQDYLTKG